MCFYFSADSFFAALLGQEPFCWREALSGCCLTILSVCWSPCLSQLFLLFPCAGSGWLDEQSLRSIVAIVEHLLEVSIKNEDAEFKTLMSRLNMWEQSLESWLENFRVVSFLGKSNKFPVSQAVLLISHFFFFSQSFANNGSLTLEITNVKSSWRKVLKRQNENLFDI